VVIFSLASPWFCHLLSTLAPFHPEFRNSDILTWPENRMALFVNGTSPGAQAARLLLAAILAES
jgi:hypothetical protein